MDLKFEVAARIARPVSEVFVAVADPAQLSRYFTTGGAKGRLETGSTVHWDFHDFPGAFPVEIVEVEKDRRIVLRWAANDGAPSHGSNRASICAMACTNSQLVTKASAPPRSENAFRGDPAPGVALGIGSAGRC